MNSKQKHSKEELLIAKFGCCCWWCLRKLDSKQLTIDHLIPKSKGGSDALENLRLACFKCNNSRGNSLFPPRKTSKSSP